MTLYEPLILSAAQCRTLTALSAGDRVAIDSLANPGHAGPVVALVDDLEYLVDEDGTLQVHGAGVAA